MLTTILLLRRPLWATSPIVIVSSLVVLATIAAWIARNRQYGEAFGQRVPAQRDVFRELERAVPGAFSWWFALRAVAREAGLEWWLQAGSLLGAAACLALLFSNLTRISSDSTDSHASFANHRKPAFLLLSDRDGEVRKRFRVKRRKCTGARTSLDSASWEPSGSSRRLSLAAPEHDTRSRRAWRHGRLQR